MTIHIAERLCSINNARMFITTPGGLVEVLEVTTSQFMANKLMAANPQLSLLDTLEVLSSRDIPVVSVYLLADKDDKGTDWSRTKGRHNDT